MVNTMTEATVRFTRTEPHSGLYRRVTVQVDGHVVGRLRNSSTLDVPVEAGRHTVRTRSVSRSLTVTSPTVSLTARGGQVVEVHVSSTVSARWRRVFAFWRALPIEVDESADPHTAPVDRVIMALVACVLAAVIAAIAVPLVVTVTQPALRYDNVTGLTCGPDGHCVAVVPVLEVTTAKTNRSDQLPLISTNAGASWNTDPIQARSAQNGVSAGVSCVSATRCIASGTSIGGGTASLTDDGGMDWMTLHFAGVSETTGTTCPTTRTCFVIGWQASGDGYVFRTRDAGLRWNDEPVPVLFPNAIACLGATHCLVAGRASKTGPAFGALVETKDGGLTWSPVTAPAPNVFVFAMTCIGSHCHLVGTQHDVGVALQTTDTALQLQWSKLPNQVGIPRVVTCSSKDRCVVGGSGGIAVTAHAGRSWTYALHLGNVVAVYCNPVGTCVAGGNRSESSPAIYRSTNDGQAWNLVWSQQSTF
jgi:hypothetical protein